MQDVIKNHQPGWLLPLSLVIKTNQGVRAFSPTATGDEHSTSLGRHQSLLWGTRLTVVLHNTKVFCDPTTNAMSAARHHCSFLRDPKAARVPRRHCCYRNWGESIIRHSDCLAFQMTFIQHGVAKTACDQRSFAKVRMNWHIWAGKYRLAGEEQQPVVPTSTLDRVMRGEARSSYEMTIQV